MDINKLIELTLPLTKNIFIVYLLFIFVKLLELRLLNIIYINLLLYLYLNLICVFYIFIKYCWREPETFIAIVLLLIP